MVERTVRDLSPEGTFLRTVFLVACCQCNSTLGMLASLAEEPSFRCRAEGCPRPQVAELVYKHCCFGRSNKEHSLRDQDPKKQSPKILIHNGSLCFWALNPPTPKTLDPQMDPCIPVKLDTRSRGTAAVRRTVRVRVPPRSGGASKVKQQPWLFGSELRFHFLDSGFRDVRPSGLCLCPRLLGCWTCFHVFDFNSSEGCTLSLWLQGISGLYRALWL